MARIKHKTGSFRARREPERGLRPVEPLSHHLVVVRLRQLLPRPKQGLVGLACDRLPLRWRPAASSSLECGVVCPRCGAEAPEGARFCPSCGAEIASAAQRRERKFVSVLFVDMVGSTAHTDGADPEDVRDRKQLYYDEVRDRIERHGGMVEKYVGDAVMASSALR